MLEGRNIAVLGGFKTYKLNGKYYINYWHYVYIDFLCSNFRMVYLLTPVLRVSQIENKDYLLEYRNLHIIELPYYDKFVQGIKLFRQHFAGIRSLKHVDTFYCLFPSPYCWMPKLLFRKKCIMECVGDTIEVMLRNSHYSTIKKLFLIICYMPEYLLSILALRLSNTYTCGLHLQKRLEVLGVKSKPLISSLLTEEEFYEKNFDFKGNLLYVGFIRYSKGLETLIETVQLLKNNGLNVRLDIVGDGEFMDELKGMVKIKGLDTEVTMHGHIGNRNHLMEFYRKSDIFLFPSLSEGSPRVVLEAMANSLPVVSTPVGTLPYLFKDNKEIKFANFNDAKSFFDRIIEYITNREITQEIVNEAYQKVKKNYTMERFLNKLFETSGK